jgi:phosphoglycerate dehydrogenase-like enzyme
LLAEAEILSLHLPLTKTTRRLIDAAALQRLRRQSA